MNRNINAKNMEIDTFLSELSSKSETPGGGGAAALVGSIGICLAGMIGSLTKNKKGYEAYQDENEILLTRVKILNDDFLKLIDEDAKAFSKLMKIYKTKSKYENENDYKKELLEATINSASKPLQIMKLCKDGIEIQERFFEIGNKNLLSDVASGVILLKASMEAAAINVYVNTKSIKENEQAIKMNDEVKSLLEIYKKRADNLYNEVIKCWN